VADVLRRQDPLSVKVEAAIEELLADDDQSLPIRLLVGSPHFTPAMASLVAASSNVFIRLEAASSPVTPQDVLDLLAGDPDWRVRAAVATNLWTSGGALDRLVHDPQLRVRSRLVSSFACPDRVLVTATFDGQLSRLAFRTLKERHLDDLSWFDEVNTAELFCNDVDDRAVVRLEELCVSRDVFDVAIRLAPSFTGTTRELAAAAQVVLDHRA
jgi:hypothetical protein